MRWLYLAAVLGTAACSTLQVHTDHDPQADFSKFQTYAWAPEATTKQAPDISGVPSPLVEKRIRVAVDSTLSTKGLRKVEPGQSPDLLIVDHVTQKERIDSTGSSVGFGYGIGHGGWAGSMGFPAGRITQETEGTLVIDLIDARTSNLVWRGIATDVLEGPEESQEQISEAVAETLERFPPETKKG